VTRVLQAIVNQRGAPQFLRSDNGPEVSSRHYLAWCVEHRIAMIHIQPGKPTQNGHVESFHGRLRDECLNASWFWNLWDARRKISAWRVEYNQQRPHSSLAYRTPEEFARDWAQAASPSTNRNTTPPELGQGQAHRAPTAALPQFRGRATCHDGDAAIYAPHCRIT
jgi:putative transposase